MRIILLLIALMIASVGRAVTVSTPIWTAPPSATATITSTVTPTFTFTSTGTITPTATFTRTDTPTTTSSFTATNTNTPTVTRTPTVTLTYTVVHVICDNCTPIPNTNTQTFTPTVTNTPTITYTPTVTRTYTVAHVVCDNCTPVPNTPTPVTSSMDSNGNTAQAISAPIENITSLNTYTVSNSAVTVVNLTTTVGTTCPLGCGAWICSPSAAIFFQYGNLTFTPSVPQMQAGYAGQIPAGWVDEVWPHPIKDGGKIYLLGQTGTSIVTIKTGCYLAK